MRRSYLQSKVANFYQLLACLLMVQQYLKEDKIKAYTNLWNIMIIKMLGVGVAIDVHRDSRPHVLQPLLLHRGKYLFEQNKQNKNICLHLSIYISTYLSIFLLAISDFEVQKIKRSIGYFAFFLVTNVKPAIYSKGNAEYSHFVPVCSVCCRYTFQCLVATNDLVRGA